MNIKPSLIEFNGDWNFNVTMKELSKLNLDYFDDDEHIEEREILKSGKIQVIIKDSIDYNPDPTESQLNTLYYIQNNEISILKSIYKCMAQKVLLKCEFKDDVENPSMFQSLDYNFESLQMHLGISFLRILLNTKKDQSYYVLDFNFKGYSDWNVLTFVMHKNKVISFGDENYDDLRTGIMDDGGSEADHHDFSSDSFRDRLFKMFPNVEYFKPLKKYNKLKPWQSYLNEFKLEQLLINSDIIEFRRIINTDLIDPNFPFIYMDGGSIINRACLKNKPEFVEFLLSKKVQTKNIHIYSHTVEVYKILIKYGLDINRLIHGKWNKAIILISRIAGSLKYDSDYTTNLQILEILLDHGADIENCDHQNRNYKEVLLDQYSANELSKLGIEDVVNNAMKAST